MAKSKELSTREQVRAVAGVAALSFKTAPGAVIFKLIGSVINALLPIATMRQSRRILQNVRNANRRIGYT
jgi:hypothetical protein